MTERERFIVLLDHEALKPSDAIILLEGDGLARVVDSLKLLRAGLADRIVVSGGVDLPVAGCIHGGMLVQELMARGVSEDQLILDDRSMNTRDQAVETMNLARSRNWERIILVASHYHQYRAFLTFLKARSEAGLDLEILNAPVRDLPWFETTPWGARVDLLESEFSKIETYFALGHIATFQEGIEHQRWKACRI